MPEYVTKIRTSRGDLPVDYNSLANLPELNTMFSNPNLLINSDFRNPVNQRGATTYQEASDWTYCIDRWKYFNQMTVEVLTGAVKFASHGTGQSWFMQEFEKELPSDNYTLSVKVSSVSGTCDMKFENSSGVQVEKVIDGTGITTLSFNGPVSAVTFELDGEGSQLTIEWIKLEQGTIATPFVPRLYGEELALCQRYYEERTLVFFPLGGDAPSSNYVAVNGGQHFVVKRDVPTATVGTLYDYTGADSGATVKSNTCTAKSLRAINLNTSCDDYMLRATVTFDAEIY